MTDRYKETNPQTADKIARQAVGRQTGKCTPGETDRQAGSEAGRRVDQAAGMQTNGWIIKQRAAP